ncbi:uncharacterized protein LOC124256972 isoform X2 [Haliotis rubra]|uniref:uncharacterized protein LOC124256972 isoform X2 n=1 Tax=Haliotis rubra TaxID=36100 RepID=UPI001EE5A035|nr:uncharacterized protein LOC124256972 isoform X2 [Haliotis rubra]
MTYLVLILVVQIFVNTSMQHPSLSVAGSRLSACYGHTGLATSVPGRQVTRRTKMASARIMLPVVVVGAITTLPIGTIAEPEGPTQIQLGKTEPPTTDVDVVNLTCSANCLPDCRYSWTKSGQDLTSQTRGSRGQVLELRKQDSGYYTCTAVNLLSNHTNSISYVQNVPPSHDPVAADAGLSMFGFGVGAGVAGSVVVVIIVSCLVLRKYRRMKRAVDFPYASTQQLPNAGMEHSHYQELPTPQLVDGGYSLADGDRAEVFTRKVDTKETDGTNTITATNPVYDLIHDDRVLPK